MIKIIQERKKDYRKVEEQTRESFWDVYEPGCNEHYLVHKIRKSDAYIKELALVAVQNHEIVGSIFCTKAYVVDEHKHSTLALMCGPIGVLPGYQGLGIGQMLMRKAIRRAKQLQFKAIFLYGEPKYYHRFGYRNAIEYNVQTADGKNFDAFMVLELEENALNGVVGRCFEHAVFKIDEGSKEFIDYENTFPYRVKLRTKSVFDETEEAQ
jgi:predicted N-acetyltransferase YhbS